MAAVRVNEENGRIVVQIQIDIHPILTPTPRVKEEDVPIVVQIKYDRPGIGSINRSFLIHKDDPLRTILVDFCNSVDHNLVYASTKFMLNGVRVCDTKTPRDLEMKDGDIINAIRVVYGGKEAQLPPWAE